MLRGIVRFLPCLFLAIIPAEGKVSVFLGESLPEIYLKPAEQSHGHLSKADLITSATSLLSVGAISHVNAETSAKVSALVNANPFQKPTAIAAFVLGGIHQGAAESLPGIVHRFEADQKESVLGALSSLSQAQSIEHTSLDLSTLPGCGDICLETTLQEAIVSLGLDANYSLGSASMRGKLSLQMPQEANAAEFDLQVVADRLFAIELASTWRAVTDLLAEKERRESQEPGSYQKPALIERVLISAKALSDAYSPESIQYRTACCLIHHLVADSIQRLNQAYDNRVATMIAVLEDSEFKDGSNGLVELIAWSSRSQRPMRSLLQVNEASGDDQYIQGFIAWIAMWGTFFLLLFFAISGCHCLRKMKFKQDSLLYGKNKSD